MSQNATTKTAQALRLLGGYHPLFRWYRQWRPRWLWKKIHLVGRVTSRFVKLHGLTVSGGAFRGLRFPSEAVGRSNFLPARLLGLYEREVVDVMVSVLPEIDLFVDVGSSDGYFCVGLARMSTTVEVIGFETTRRERRLAQRVAMENEVSIDFRPKATPGSLDSLPEGRTLFLIDVEGYEEILVDPILVPRFRTSTLIVELHETVVPTIESILSNRFQRTHQIRLISGEPVAPRSIPLFTGWSDRDAALAVSDGRPQLGRWLVLQPHLMDGPIIGR